MDSLIILVGFLSVFSCQKEDTISISKDVKIATPSLAAIAGTSLDAPTGWYQEQTATGVRLFSKSYKRNGNTTKDFVQVIDLSKGAKIYSFYGGATGGLSASESNPSPAFYKYDIDYYWWSSFKNLFSITNASFFNFSQSTLYSKDCQFAYPFKYAGTVISCGYSNLEIAGNTDALPKRTLNIYEKDMYASIQTYKDAPAKSTKKALYAHVASNLTATTAIVGLHPLDADKDKTSYIPRTLVGVRDYDGNGKAETIYIFTSSYANQTNAWEVLNSEFKASQTIMFDGSGSTQMKCKNIKYIKSNDPVRLPVLAPERKIPNVLSVISG